MPPTTPLHHLGLACAAVLVLLTTLVARPSFAGASSADTALGTADDSPIAVPFIGTFEMWCSDRNPAPGNRCSRHHGTPAIDFGMDIGTKIHATGSGVVIETETGCGPGYCRGGAGNFISIGHADGTFSRYLHLTDVLVSAGDDIAVGQQIGTSGITGQSSSAHLHYDEHFPAGTRTPMGPWIGCVSGEAVRYPDVFGYSDWNDVPYGALVVNEGYGCLDGVDVSDIARATVLPGSSKFGVIAPTENPRTRYEVSIATQDGSTPLVVPLRGTALALFPSPDAPVAIRLRELVDGVWQEWSDPVPYAPGANAAVDATQGVAPPDCGGLYATAAPGEGTPAADVLIGTDGPDQILARGGDDLICGLDGDDVIVAGPGRDTIWGGDGADQISGGFGADLILGGAGDDNVRGGNGPDTIRGGIGDDTIHGTAGNDRLEGGRGFDLLIGGIGHDRLFGGADDDRLEGRNGRDYLGGGNGDDSLSGGNGRDRLVGAGGTDDLNGGPGDDRCAPDQVGLDELLEGCER